MKVLTLDELYDIFETSQYDQFRTDFGGDVFMKRKSRKKPTLETGIFYLSDQSLLYQHIVAERILTIPMKFEDWQHMCAYFPPIILKLAYLWTHPLAWIEKPEEDGIVVKGKVAKEYYDTSRNKQIWDLLNQLLENAVLYFADDLPVSDIDDSWEGSIKNTHLWEFITANTHEQAVAVMFDPAFERKNSEKYKRFNEHALRRSIMLISEKRNGKLAADILRLLQNEWPSLKTWKAMEIDKLTEDEIHKFEYCLFHGFDKELNEWDSELQNKEIEIPQEGDYIELVKWLESEKAKGHDYYTEAGNNRSKMCRELTKILKWKVKENSLRKAQQR